MAWEAVIRIAMARSYLKDIIVSENVEYYIIYLIVQKNKFNDQSSLSNPEQRASISGITLDLFLF